MSHALNAHLAGRSIQGAPPEAWGALGDWLTDKISAGYNYPIGQNLPEAPRIPKINIDPQALLAASYGLPGAVLPSTPGENTVETDAVQNIAEILGYDLFANKDSRTLGNIGVEVGGAAGDLAQLSAKFGPAVLALLAGKTHLVDDVIPVTRSGFDPRFDPRTKEQERLRNLSVRKEGETPEPSTVRLQDYEGQPFITSMSDRTAAGSRLVDINDVTLNSPVQLRGGQDYMFMNPGQVWASGRNPVNQITGLAEDIKRVTGQDPLFIPWRMAPTGGDFSTQTGEAMLAFAASRMSKRNIAKANTAIKKVIPGWKGISDPKSIEQFQNAPDAVRKDIKNMLDVRFRDEGGLSIGEARLSVADEAQLRAPDAGIQNVGRIDTSSPIIDASGHPSYPFAVPGEGLGRIGDDISVFELLPDVAKNRRIDIKAPRQTDIRALQMKPYGGTLTEDILRALE